MMTDTDRPAIQFVSQESALDVFLKLKERPAFVLLLLCNSDHPLTRDEIVGITNWGPNQVRTALVALDFHHLAVQGRERGPWSPTLAGRNLFTSQPSSTVDRESDLGPEGPRGFKKFSHPFGGVQHPPTSSQTLPTNKLARFDSSSTVDSQNASNDPLRSFEGQRESTVDHSDVASSTTELSSLGSQAPQWSYGQNGNGGGPSAEKDWFKVDLRRKQREIACRQVGINPPALTEFIQNDNIEPLFIFAHAWQVNKQGGSLGLVVHRIRKGYSVSKEAAHYAEGEMHWDTSVKCQHCHRRFSVTLDLGEEIEDCEFDCPHCQQSTRDADHLNAKSNGHQADEEQTE